MYSSVSFQRFVLCIGTLNEIDLYRSKMWLQSEKECSISFPSYFTRQQYIFIYVCTEGGPFKEAYINISPNCDDTKNILCGTSMVPRDQ